MESGTGGDSGGSNGVNPAHDVAGDDATVLLSPDTITPPADADATVLLTTPPGDAGDATVLLQPSDHATPLEVADLAPGMELNLAGQRVRVVAAIGRGGAEGRTYRVESGGRDLVLKVYHRQSGSLETVLSRVACSRHPNIIRIHQVGSAGAKTWELMEYHQGGTLADYLRASGPIKDATAIRELLAAIHAGLRELHEVARVVYQDLKPDNILLPDGRFGQATLADFGISTAMTDSTGAVEVVANGTRDYAAPELSRFGATHTVSVTSRVDLFALGVTLLECWLGVSPFKDVADAGRRDQVLGRSVPMPDDMPQGLRDLVTGLLEPIAADRFGLEEVDAWMKGGLALRVATAKRYRAALFDGTRPFNNPRELASMMLEDPASGERLLYGGGLEQWLTDAGDYELAAEVTEVRKRYSGQQESRRAGVYHVAYRFNPSLPFMTHGGTPCRSLEDLGTALRDEHAHYLEALRSWRNPVYAYLKAHMATDLAEEALRRFSEGLKPSPRALNHLVYWLERGDSPRVRLAGTLIEDPDQLLEGSRERTQFLDELRQDHSPSLLWLKDLGAVRSANSIAHSGTADVLAIITLLPWFKLDAERDGLDPPTRASLMADAASRSPAVVKALIDAGVALDGVPSESLPLVKLALNAGAGASGANARGILEYLLSQGVSLDQVDREGTTPLIEAVRAGDPALVAYLLEQGASWGFADAKGNRPLRLAVGRALARAGNEPPLLVVKALLAAGADPLAWLPDNSGSIFDGVVAKRDLELVQALKAAPAYSEADAVSRGHPVLAAARVSWKEGVELLAPPATMFAKMRIAEALLALGRGAVWVLFCIVCLAVPAVIFLPPDIPDYPIVSAFTPFALSSLFQAHPGYVRAIAAVVLCILVALSGVALKYLMRGETPLDAMKQALRYAAGNKAMTLMLLAPLLSFGPMFVLAVAATPFVGNKTEAELESYLHIATGAAWSWAVVLMVLVVVLVNRAQRRNLHTFRNLRTIARQTGAMGGKGTSRKTGWLILLACVAVVAFLWFQ